MRRWRARRRRQRLHTSRSSGELLVRVRANLRLSAARSGWRPQDCSSRWPPRSTPRSAYGSIAAASRSGPCCAALGPTRRSEASATSPCSTTRQDRHDDEAAPASRVLSPTRSVARCSATDISRDLHRCTSVAVDRCPRPPRAGTAEVPVWAAREHPDRCAHRVVADVSDHSHDRPYRPLSVARRARALPHSSRKFDPYIVGYARRLADGPSGSTDAYAFTRACVRREVPCSRRCRGNSSSLGVLATCSGSSRPRRPRDPRLPGRAMRPGRRDRRRGLAVRLPVETDRPSPTAPLPVSDALVSSRADGRASCRPGITDADGASARVAPGRLHRSRRGVEGLWGRPAGIVASPEPTVPLSLAYDRHPLGPRLREGPPR